MESRPDSHVHFTVSPSGNDQWAVFEAGFGPPIASFADKADAIDYAHRLAHTKQSADVEVSG